MSDVFAKHECPCGNVWFIPERTDGYANCCPSCNTDAYFKQIEEDLRLLREAHRKADLALQPPTVTPKIEDDEVREAVEWIEIIFNQWTITRGKDRSQAYCTQARSMLETLIRAATQKTGREGLLNALMIAKRDFTNWLPNKDAREAAIDSIDKAIVKYRGGVDGAR